MLFTGFVALALAPLAVSSCTPTQRIVHESRSASASWTPVRRAEPDAILPLSIALTQPNLEQLNAYLLDVAHPASTNYGKHWTPAAVADAFRPSAAAVDVVRGWLVNDAFIEPSRIALSKDGQWITLNATVEEAEHLLGTEYYVFEHADGTTHVGCRGGYSLPERVSKHVDIITPTLHFAIRPKKMARFQNAIRPLISDKADVSAILILHELLAEVYLFSDYLHWTLPLRPTNHSRLFARVV